MGTTQRFDDLFGDMAQLRYRYEHLRSSGGSFDERARILSRLQTLRADIAGERRSMIR